MKRNRYGLTVFHVKDFLVAFDVALDELFGFLADTELLMHSDFPVSFLGQTNSFFEADSFTLLELCPNQV